MTLARFLRDCVCSASTLRVGGREHRIMRLLVALVATMALVLVWRRLELRPLGNTGIAMVIAAAWSRFAAMPAALGWLATIAFFVLTIVIFGRFARSSVDHLPGCVLARRAP
jgi:hypothetical protein